MAARKKKQRRAQRRTGGRRERRPGGPEATGAGQGAKEGAPSALRQRARRAHFQERRRQGNRIFRACERLDLLEPNIRYMITYKWEPNWSFTIRSSSLEEIVEIKIWKVPRSEEYPEGFKYSLVYVRKGKRVLGYDNYQGHGHHKHIDTRGACQIFCV